MYKNVPLIYINSYLRLLPAPGHPPSVNLSHKQYLDPSLIPDVPAEPNEQILRLMASLGIDSSRTREVTIRCGGCYIIIMLLFLLYFDSHCPRKFLEYTTSPLLRYSCVPIAYLFFFSPFGSKAMTTTQQYTTYF